MSIDIKNIYGSKAFKVIDEEKKLFLADPFIYKIFPEDYSTLTELLIDNPETFSNVNKIQAIVEKSMEEGLEPENIKYIVLKSISSNLKVFNKFRNNENYSENLLMRLKLIKNYKSFFKEVGASLKFNPISHRAAANQIRTRLFEFLKEYLPLIRPKVLFQIVKVKCNAEGLIIENDGSLFQSRNLSEFFSNYNFQNQNYDEMIIYVVTIGPGMDDEVKNLSQHGEVFDAYVLNGIGSGAAEMVANDLNLFMNDVVKSKDEQLQFKRFSPGYSDWNISDQKIIFNLLEPEKHIGVHLTDSYVMIPEKSTSGIIGLTSKSY